MRRKLYQPGIYALVCEGQTIKYVGVGKDWNLRGSSHWKQFLSKGTAINSRVMKWFVRLLSEGKSPILKLIERCSSYEVAQERERFWIKTYRAYEEATCNITDGGNHVPPDLSKIGGTNGGTETQKRWRGTSEQSAWCAEGAKNLSPEDRDRAARLGGKARGKQLSSPEGREHQSRVGKLGILHKSPEDQLKAALAGGAARAKQLSSPEGRAHQSEAGKKGAHSYNHARRGILKPGCKFCFPS
jgi:hypothetical protein